MFVMQVGDAAPDFELEANDGTKVRLSSFKGQKNVILCFYPKNHLFMCPSKKVFEAAQSIISSYGDIVQADAVLFAISVDTVRAQKEFVEQYSVPYLHLSDTTKSVCKTYAGLNMAGLAKRTTFIVDKTGIIQNIFSDIDAKAHGKQIAQSLEDLK